MLFPLGAQHGLRLELWYDEVSSTWAMVVSAMGNGGVGYALNRSNPQLRLVDVHLPWRTARLEISLGVVIPYSKLWCLCSVPKHIVFAVSTAGAIAIVLLR